MFRITSTFSAGVAAEEQAWEKYAEQNERLFYTSSPEEYAQSGDSVAPKHYCNLVGLIGDKSKILDVGVGAGQSSMFLVSRGHSVFALEPVKRFCELIERSAQKFGASVSVVHGVGEDIGEIDQQFDAIFFNASLHHCDDPVKALASSYSRLKEGGRIFLVNENFLRPWRSKEWFRRRLETNPDEMGHYGGNEHAYHNWEYCDMLRAAGFSSIQRLRPAKESAIDKLEFVLSRRVDGRRLHTKITGITARLLYYAIEERVGGIDIIMRASLVPCHFTAIKQCGFD